ncbi:hypothetical protein [Clostridium sp.]|uniref:hypothetical protein n=1 Tax=Clostridium sp. TaxID=1506 RepID=UPI0032162E62
MKIGLKKSSILSGCNRGMLGVFGIFGISTLILYIAYLNGLVGIQNEVHFVLIENIFIYKLVVPFYFISKTLLALLPEILGIIFLISYFKIFSYKAIRINIIPLGNREKIIKLFLIYGIYSLIYVISIGVIGEIGYIYGLGHRWIIELVIIGIDKISSVGFFMLMVMIVDINCKIKLSDRDVEIFWIVTSVFVWQIEIHSIEFLFNKLGMWQYAIVVVLLIASIIEGLYIFKKIDEVKIV